MIPPHFWEQNRPTLPARLLSPVAAIVTVATARRVARPGWHAPVPVVCCGNVTVGGAGKTTVALDLGRRLLARGVGVAFLTRGYGGSSRGVRRVQPGDPPRLAGDEPLLLAEVAPTWTGADRAASARAAIAGGAEILVMDDELQNRTLAKDLSLLVVDGAAGFGNGFVLPAGPLREPVAAGAVRCVAAILIGPDQAGVRTALAQILPALSATLCPHPPISGLAGKPFLAVAGIGRPEKFFSMLETAELIVAERAAFPDHHIFTRRELCRLKDRAARSGLTLVTTPKDAVRLPPEDRAAFQVIGVSLAWEDDTSIDRLVDRLVDLARRS